MRVIGACAEGGQVLQEKAFLAVFVAGWWLGWDAPKCMRTVGAWQLKQDKQNVLGLTLLCIGSLVSSR